MPIDSGDVTIAPDGSATGDGLAKALYDALADEYDAFPGQLPAASSPGAQENLAKMARGISEPIALGVNEGIEVTADPGEVLGVALDAGAPQIAEPLTPAQLNAIVGSIALHLAQYLGFGSNPAGVPVGDIRGDGPFAIVGNDSVQLGSLGAGGVAITAVAGPGSLHGVTLDLEATAGAAAIDATAGIDLSPGANQPVRIASGLVRLIERAAGIALSAGQALLFAKDDAPNNPYFRDDTNADRKIATAPIPLSDFATQAEATVLLRALGAGTGVPSAGSATQLNAIVGSAVLTMVQSLLMVERAAGVTLTAGQAQFFARNDTPNTPMFRDDTNVDHKLVRAPVPLSDMATIAQGTALGRAVLTGTGVPGALTGLQQGQNLRRATTIVDSTTTGVVATYPLGEDTTQVIFSGSGTIQLEGATIIAGKEINWSVELNATVVVTFMNDGAPTITQERFRTHTQRQVTIRAGESVTTGHVFNRHRFISVSKRSDPQLTSVVREDFDGQCDAAGVLARSPWIAWDSPTIAQADTATSGFHSINHPGILQMQSDAALADECAIYRGPFDFATIATFGASIMIPVDGVNALLNCAMGFGIVSDPTDMDVSTSGGVWTDNNLAIIHRSGGASAGNWLVRRENAGSGAAVSTGVAIVAGTWATFRLEQTAPGSGSWRCYINGTLFTTATLANTSGIAYLAIGMIRGAGAAGRNLLVDEIMLDTFELNRAAA